LDSLSEGNNNELLEGEIDFDGIGQFRLDYQHVKSNSQKSRISSQNKSNKGCFKNEQNNES